MLNSLLAIIPAAGLGTRFLPATKTIPKELFPIFNKPSIELVVTEATEFGAKRILIITNEDKDNVITHFFEDLLLEKTLKDNRKNTLLRKLRFDFRSVKIDSIIQNKPLGLGHAISCAENSLKKSENTVAILLPDDLLRPTGILKTMSEVKNKYGGSVLCVTTVTDEKISSYGVLEVEHVLCDTSPNILKVKGIVEKPKYTDAPSSYAIIGRYLLERTIFDVLHKVPIGINNEIQLTDAISLLIKDKHPVYAVVYRGIRHDIGHPFGYLKATIDYALQQKNYNVELRDWLLNKI